MPPPAMPPPPSKKGDAPLKSSLPEMPQPPKPDPELQSGVQSLLQKTKEGGAPAMPPPPPKQTKDSGSGFSEMPQPPKEDGRSQRSAISDIPPITVSPDKQGLVTKDQVQELNVDDFVLPGQQVPEEPEPAPEPAPAPEPQEGPLYIDIKVYERVQRTLRKLHRQLGSLDKEITRIQELSASEDAQFAQIVEKIESLQDGLLEADHNLFEQ